MYFESELSIDFYEEVLEKKAEDKMIFPKGI